MGQWELVGCLSMRCFKGGCQAGARCGSEGSPIHSPRHFWCRAEHIWLLKNAWLRDPEVHVTGEAEGLC